MSGLHISFTAFDGDPPQICVRVTATATGDDQRGRLETFERLVSLDQSQLFLEELKEAIVKAKSYLSQPMPANFSINRMTPPQPKNAAPTNQSQWRGV